MTARRSGLLERLLSRSAHRSWTSELTAAFRAVTKFDAIWDGARDRARGQTSGERRKWLRTYLERIGIDQARREWRVVQEAKEYLDLLRRSAQWFGHPETVEPGTDSWVPKGWDLELLATPAPGEEAGDEEHPEWPL